MMSEVSFCDPFMLRSVRFTDPNRLKNMQSTEFSTLSTLAPTVTPIIMHLEHTGGSTLRKIVENQYTDDQIYYLFYNKSKTPVDDLMAMSEAQRERYRVFLGHLFYGLHRWVPGESAYLTWMRDPIERIVSGYYYQFRKPQRRHHQAYVSGAMTWARHLNMRWRSAAQVGRVVGGDDDLIRRFNTQTLSENAVETALNHLENDFVMVGVTERYDEMLLLMKQLLGWQNPVTYVRVNVSVNRPRYSDLSAEDKKLIEAAAEIEYPVYEYAKKRFERDLSRYAGDLEKDLAEFKRQNAEYNARFQARKQRIEQFKRPFRRVKRWMQSRIKTRV